MFYICIIYFFVYLVVACFLSACYVFKHSNFFFLLFSSVLTISLSLVIILLQLLLQLY